MGFLVILAVFCSWQEVNSARELYKGRVAFETNETEGANCAALGSIGTVGGENFADLGTLVCKNWPPSLGTFPFTSATSVIKFLQLAFGKGGLWEDMKKIWGDRRNARFCWRNQTLRDVAPPGSSYKCRFTAKSTCYGKCPRGYRKGFLKGLFKPICVSACADTFHTVSCGFGCANTRLNCARTVFDQIASIVKEVTTLISLAGQVALAETINSVIAVVEFALNVLPQMVRALKNAHKYVSKGHKHAALFILLYQLVAKIYPDGTKNPEVKKAKWDMKTILQYILDLCDGDITNLFSWVTAKKIVVRQLKKVLVNKLKNLPMIKRIVKAFTYKTCGEMQRNSVLTLEGGGYDDANGQWVKYYDHNKRASYARQNSKQFQLEYSIKNKAWRIKRKQTIGSDKILYAAYQDTSDFPTDGWVAVDGPQPVPTFISTHFTCAMLEDLEVNGRGFGKIAGTVCHFWPESLGRFPLDNEIAANDILNQAFSKTGIWEQLAHFKTWRYERDGFCWRTETTRQVLPDTSAKCALKINGTCFGDCPWGYRKSSLVGGYQATCSSACGESELNFPCGMACTDGKLNCAKHLAEQAFEVTRWVGSLAGFAFGSETVTNVVEKLTYIGEFVLLILPHIVERAKETWSKVKENGRYAALVTVILQFIYENHQEDYEKMRDNMGETIAFIIETVQAVWNWKVPELGWIKERLIAHGGNVLNATADLTETIMYRRCKPMSNSSNFLVDSAGEDAVLGLWIEDGKANNKPKYVLRSDHNYHTAWVNGCWEMRYSSLFSSNFLYKNCVQGAVKPPWVDWQVVKGAKPAPIVLSKFRRCKRCHLP